MVLDLFKALQSPGGFGAAALLMKSAAVTFVDAPASYYAEERRPDLFEHASVAYKTVSVNSLSAMPGTKQLEKDLSKWEQKLDAGEVLPAIITTPSAMILDGHHRVKVLKNRGASFVRIGELRPHSGYRFEIGQDAVSSRTIVNIVPE
jgi:hypothetical protein